MPAERKTAPNDDARWSALMKAAQDGDSEALRTLYLEITPVILAFCEKRASYLGVSDDVVQESLMAIHRNRQVYLPERSFRAWMFAIVRSKLIDQIRKHNRRQLKEILSEETETSPARETYTNLKGGISANSHPDEHESLDLIDERTLLLRKAISGLSPKYREVISLVKIEGYSVKEAAIKLSISESAVKVRTHRAFKQLEKEFVLEDESDA